MGLNANKNEYSIKTFSKGKKSPSKNDHEVMDKALQKLISLQLSCGPRQVLLLVQGNDQRKNSSSIWPVGTRQDAYSDKGVEFLIK